MAKELLARTECAAFRNSSAGRSDALRHGRAIGEYLKKEFGSAHVLIGMDTRESGPHIAQLLTAGLQAAGASAEFAGVITTPGVACLVRENDFQAGVVISASHNPYHDNGVKLFFACRNEISGRRGRGAGNRHSETAHGSSASASAKLAANQALHMEYLDFLRSQVIPGANLAGKRWCWIARTALRTSWGQSYSTASAPRC